MISGCPEVLLNTGDLALASVSLEGLNWKLRKDGSLERIHTVRMAESQCKKTKLMFGSEKARKF